jgi:hypothetical protein
MSNEAIAEHILHIVHKYDEDWNDTVKQYEREHNHAVGLVELNPGYPLKFPQPPTKPPATVLLDRIKATLEHYNEQTN